MAKVLGSALAPVLLVFLGMFLSIAAYSRKPLLLKIASIGLIHIDPDHPGQTQRAILFSVGMLMIFVGLALLVLDRLHGLGLVGSG
jgi:hypothetical protein